MGSRVSKVKQNSCIENVETLEERVQWAKDDVKKIWKMLANDAIAYSAEDACIGHVYRKLYFAKKSLKRATKQADKQNKGDK